MTYGWNTIPQNCFPTFMNGFVPQSCWPTNQWPTQWPTQWTNQWPAQWPNQWANQFANPWTTPYAYGMAGCAPQFAQYPAPYANQYANPQFISQPTFNFPYAGINQPTNLWSTIPTFGAPASTPWNATPWNTTPWTTTPNATPFPQSFSPFSANPIGIGAQAPNFTTPTQGFTLGTQVNGYSPTQFAVNQHGQLGIFGTQHFQHHYPAPTTLNHQIPNQYPNQFPGQFPGNFHNPLAQNWTNVLPVTNCATPYTPTFNTGFNPGFNPTFNSGFATGFIPSTPNGFTPTPTPGTFSPLSSPIGTPINTQPFPGTPLETIEPNGQLAQGKRQNNRAGV